MVLLGRRLAPALGEDLTLTGICLRSWPSRNGFHLPCSFNSSLCARALLANLAIDLDICGPVFILLTLSLNLRMFLSALLDLCVTDFYKAYPQNGHDQHKNELYVIKFMDQNLCVNK